MGKINTDKEFLRPKEAQAYLGVSHGKLYQLIRKGAFPISKPDPDSRLTFISRSDLIAFINKGYSTRAE